jgi:4-hydroxy-tetrahydrodipicolinate synthase
VLGIAGWCTAAPNLINSVPQQIFRAVHQDDLEQARSLFLKYKTLLTFISEKGLARTVKAGLELQGISAGIPRKPIQPLADTDVETLAMLLSKIGDN